MAFIRTTENQFRKKKIIASYMNLRREGGEEDSNQARRKGQ